MIIIYHCYGGAHSSVLSAAIHTRILPDDRKPSNKDILKIPYFDKTTSNQIGIPFYYGDDEYGNKIYIQGMGGSDKVVKQLLKELMTKYEIPEKDVIMVDTLKNVNILVRIGGFLSRGLGLVFPGRYLTVLGLMLNYNKFVNTVSQVKAKIAEFNIA